MKRRRERGYRTIALEQSLRGVVDAVAVERGVSGAAVCRAAIAARLATDGVIVEARETSNRGARRAGVRLSVDIAPDWFAAVRQLAPRQPATRWVSEAVVAYIGERAARVYEPSAARTAKYRVCPTVPARREMMMARRKEFMRQCADESHGPAGWTA